MKKTIVTLLTLVLCSLVYAQSYTDLQLFEVKGDVKTIKYDNSALLLNMLLIQPDEADITETYTFDRNGVLIKCVIQDLDEEVLFSRDENKLNDFSSPIFQMYYTWSNPDEEDPDYAAPSLPVTSSLYCLIDDDVVATQASMVMSNEAVPDVYTLQYLQCGVSDMEQDIPYMAYVVYDAVDSKGNWTARRFIIAAPDYDNESYARMVLKQTRSIEYWSDNVAKSTTATSSTTSTQKETPKRTWLIGTWTSPIASFVTGFKAGSIYITEAFLTESDKTLSESPTLRTNTAKSYYVKDNYIYVNGSKKYKINDSKKTLSSLDGKVVYTKVNQ